ncbi:hypothetical protein LCGC14_1656070 [marine sediment metagenome]|uniref:Uncharacterized protein n=1 Tax=marine sediment metagenome TaxID=412755 RepID=A0A0F9IHY2_9ZZZZ
MRKLFAFVLFAFLLFAAVPAQAQEFTPEVEVGAGYSNPNDVENIIGSVFLRGISVNRFSGGAVLEARFVDGEFHTRTYARSEATLLGPTYAALDTALNGDWDPRAVFGLQLEKWVFEGYSQVDGDKSYGFVIRWRLF